MSENRRLTITVRVPVTLTVDARIDAGEVVVVDVRDVDLPSVSEVMEALDADQQFDELDRLYELAGTTGEQQA